MALSTSQDIFLLAAGGALMGAVLAGDLYGPSEEDCRSLEIMAVAAIDESTLIVTEAIEDYESGETGPLGVELSVLFAAVMALDVNDIVEPHIEECKMVDYEESMTELGEALEKAEEALSKPQLSPEI